MEHITFPVYCPAKGSGSAKKLVVYTRKRVSEARRANRAQFVAEQLRQGAHELLRLHPRQSALAARIFEIGCTHLLEISTRGLELGNVVWKTRYEKTRETIDRILDLDRLPIADRDLDALQTLASAILLGVSIEASRR